MCGFFGTIKKIDMENELYKYVVGECVVFKGNLYSFLGYRNSYQSFIMDKEDIVFIVLTKSIKLNIN